jgi:hypothetical protein
MNKTYEISLIKISKKCCLEFISISFSSIDEICSKLTSIQCRVFCDNSLHQIVIDVYILDNYLFILKRIKSIMISIEKNLQSVTVLFMIVSIYVSSYIIYFHTYEFLC